MNLNQIIQIHKENKELGFTSYLPSLILKSWYAYHLYWQKDYICFDYSTTGFLLFDLVKSEIIIIAVKKHMQHQGIGSALIQRLPKGKIIVVHSMETDEFYEKNGFKKYYIINDNQRLRIRE